MSDQQDPSAASSGKSAPRPATSLSDGPLRDDEIEAALEEANLPSLLPAMAQLTGDDWWVRGPYRPTPQKGADDHDDAGLAPEVQRAARRDAFATIKAWRDGQFEPAPAPSKDRLVELLHLSFGQTQDLPPEIGGLLAEELGVSDRDTLVNDAAAAAKFSVLIIGAGFSGICAAIKLELAGIPYTVVEKNDEVGGTWWDNVYPGCGVDTPSHLYSLSFAQLPDWPRYFAKGEHVLGYLEQLTEQYALRDNIIFGTEVLSASWHNSDQVWTVRTCSSGGEERELTANAVIAGLGYLNRPAYPSIDGLERFAGPSMHTARWRYDVDLSGKRVAVIGTGASSMQLVPAIADTAEQVTIFQRSPQWALPNPNHNREVSPATRLLMEHVPYYMAWYRLRLVWNFGDRLFPALQVDPDWPHPERSVNRMNDRHREFLTRYIESELGDRTDLLPKCVPDYPPYGKRPLLDHGWFRTVCRDDVELVAEAVTEVRPHSVVSADGVEHPADVLVIATGFKAAEVLGPVEVRGRSGRTLRETWGQDDARAYLGITVPDFPNFFMLMGPNSFPGHGGSAALSIEMAMKHIMQLLAYLVDNGASSVECTHSAHEAYDKELTAALDRSIWAHAGVSSYYRSSNGRVVVPMPWTNAEYWNMTHEVNLDNFHVRTPSSES